MSHDSSQTGLMGTKTNRQAIQISQLILTKKKVVLIKEILNKLILEMTFKKFKNKDTGVGFQYNF